MHYLLPVLNADGGADERAAEAQHGIAEHRLAACCCYLSLRAAAGDGDAGAEAGQHET